MTSLANARDARIGTPDEGTPPTDAATRVAYQAVRALVAEETVVAVDDLTAVTDLDDRAATGAMNRLARVDPFEIEPVAAAGYPSWIVSRTDRW